MADYSNENLELIVRYDGSKTSFESSVEKAAYIAAKISKVVFITGSTATTATASDKTQHIWVSNGSTHKYLDMANIDDVKNGLTHIAGFAIEGEVKSGSGANGINFKGINGIQIKLNPELSTDNNGVAYWTIEVNGETLYNALNGVGERVDALEESVETLEGNVNTLIGEDTDSSVRDIALDEAGKVQNALIGGDTDTTQASTIAGAKKYADDVATSKANAAKDAAILASAVSVVSTTENLDEGVVKKYIISQGDREIGAINIPKDLVVTSGSVVSGTWDGDKFTEGTGTGTAIKLVIANGNTLYINAATLVDVYTAQQNAAEVQLSIDQANNVISATIVDNAVTTTKIKDGNVTKAKLENAVQTSLNLADSAIQGVVAPELDDYIKLTKEAKAIGVQYTTAAITSENASTKGLATAEDIRAYLAARLSVKVVS